MALLRIASLCGVCFAALLSGAAGRADEVPYDVRSVEDYFLQKSHVLFGLRLDGGIWGGALTESQRRVGAGVYSDEQLDALRTEDEKRYARTSRILVLKGLRGTLPVTVTVSHSEADVRALPLGEVVLIFADASAGGLTFSNCDVAPATLFPASLVQTGKAADFVSHIKANRMLCLREPREKRPVDPK
jgi:hypothetical protein